ncbi:MAG: hypothetical protein HOC70_08065 [Gammaproteobacteria bacterium]|jgi:hypothetical protein|nr:hypothetical protein [Gammaproteobacteria bacterium]MBT4493186.1 hypothetical protein [Gammaproteobacteria bacterium]MBT7370552.1 hypothetical protein [Gammaproteobacteria bacterium]
MLLQIVGYFWQMCLLRQGPEALPSSNFVTGIIFAVYLPIALTVSILASPEDTFATSIAGVAIGIFIQALVTFLLLRFKNLPSRFRATWSALLGTNSVMLLILLPIILVTINSEVETLRTFANSAMWVCFGWSLAIVGNIYHRAVNISILQGSAIAFLNELLAIFMMFTLFPVAV